METFCFPSSTVAATGHVAEGPELNDLLGLRSTVAVDDIMKVALLNPVKDVTSNRGKRIRAKLVALSYRLLAEGSTLRTLRPYNVRSAPRFWN
jgi:hypothetical protein